MWKMRLLTELWGCEVPYATLYWMGEIKRNRHGDSINRKYIRDMLRSKPSETQFTCLLICSGRVFFSIFARTLMI